MGFQQTVNYELCFGIPGAVYDDGPIRSAPYELVSASAAYNIIGATAYTLTTADTGANAASGIAAAGGTGAFVGILGQAKLYSTAGTGGNALSPTLTLPNYSIGELFTMGDLVVTLPNAANVGDYVIYNTTTGALSTTSAVVSFTASQTTTVITVTGTVTGNIGVGSIINTGALQSVVQSLGTGTGGAGTYNVNTSQTVASTTMTASNVVAPSGYALVPNAFVYQFNAAGSSGVGVIKMTA